MFLDRDVCMYLARDIDCRLDAVKPIVNCFDNHSYKYWLVKHRYLIKNKISCPINVFDSTDLDIKEITTKLISDDRRLQSMRIKLEEKICRELWRDLC